MMRGQGHHARAVVAVVRLERIIDLGDISAARATESYLHLWLRLWGAEEPTVQPAHRSRIEPLHAAPPVQPAGEPATRDEERSMKPSHFVTGATSGLGAAARRLWPRPTSRAHRRPGCGPRGRGRGADRPAAARPSFWPPIYSPWGILALAEQVKRRTKTLAVLVNNAGGSFQARQSTATIRSSAHLCAQRVGAVSAIAGPAA